MICKFVVATPISSPPRGVASRAASSTPTAAAPATEYATKTLTPDVVGTYRKVGATSANISRRVVLDWINQRVQFLGINYVALVSGTPAGRIHTICEKDDSFSTGYAA